MLQSLVFDICALIVFLSLIFTASFKKIIKGKTNILYFSELIFCTLTTFFNILFYITILYFPATNFTDYLAGLFKYMYFFSHVFIVPVAFLYILSSIGILYVFEKNEIFKIILVITILIPFCIIIDNFFSNKTFVIENLHYSTDRNIFLYYGIIFFYMTVCVAFLIFYRKFLTKSKIVIGIATYPICVLLTILQINYPDKSFMLFVYAVACYLVATTSHRPELLINPSVGVWSEFSFYNECHKGFLLNRPETVVLIKIKNYQNLILYLGQSNYLGFNKIIANNISNLLTNLRLEDNIYYLEDSCFAIVFDNILDEHLSLVVGELNYDLNNEYVYKDFKIMLNPCICVTKIPEEINTFEKFKFFTKSFYNNLPNGKTLTWINQIVSTKDFKIRNEINLIINRAFKEHNFEVFYQPIYGVKEKKFVSAEALIRLKDPQYGYVMPSVFLPHMEINGMIHQLGDFVLEEVCKFVASKEFESLGLRYVEINLSLVQCVEVNLVSKTLQTIDKYKIDHNKIRFEITESTISSNPVLIENNINMLKDNGIKFALDNYGTGYSNIQIITQLPFSVIKLDKSFVDDIQNQNMWIVVENSIHMLKQLKKEILVEGIENEESVKIFTDLKCDLMQGCEYIQGFVFSEPVPKDEFIKRVKNFN